MIENSIRSRYVAFAAVGFALGLAPIACGSGTAAGNGETSESTGSIDLALTASGSLTINSVSYSISHENGFIKTGTIDVTNSTRLAAVIGGIPAGTGYYVSLYAVPVDDRYAYCAGGNSADVVAGSTTTTSIVLTCKVSPKTGSVKINGSFNLCPTIDTLSIEPAQTTVGHSVQLAALANDPDNGPGPLEYAWFSSAGTLEDGQAPVTSFTCTEVGRAFLQLIISDGDPACPLYIQMQTIDCAADDSSGGAGGGAGGSTGGGAGGSAGSGLCGNGVIDEGETCDDRNAVSGDGCSADCQPDDNLTTPGDDRAGYVACHDTANVHGLTCAPGLLCCWSTESCSSVEDCDIGWQTQTCDGPEDCPSGLACLEQHGAFCADIDYYARRCHTNADCQLDRPVCSSDGYCTYPN